MAKDPAFLFYSRDFYEGTRMMLPEERACYIDLMIYQHQNGIIPKDLRRVLMYCSGVDEATLKATLKAKFTETDEGWLNHRLEDEISARKNFKNSLSESGKIGQFWKKAKKLLIKKEYDELRKCATDRDLLLEFIETNEINKTSIQGWLKHYANANAIVNEDNGKEKEGVGEKEKPFPTFAEFWKYTADYILEKKLGETENWKIPIEAKYNAWSQNNWKDGNGNKISNWKTKIQNTIPYLKPINNGAKPQLNQAIRR